MEMLEDAQLIIFDVDDTLYDYSASLRAAIIELQTICGDERPIDEAFPAWVTVEDAIFPRYLDGSMSLAEYRRVRLRKFHESFANLSDDELNDLFKKFLAITERHMQPVAGAPEVVQHLLEDGYRVACLTNAPRDMQRVKLKAIGIDPDQVMVFATEDVPVAKPDPSAFQTVLDAFDCQAEDAVMVGDKLDVDVKPAVRLGMRAIWFTQAGTGAPPGIAQVCSLRDLVTDIVD